MTRAPLIAVGMPVYNAEAWVRQAVVALQQQTYRDFVLIINDNASSDNTLGICEALARNDDRIRIYRNTENIGVFRNHEKVFRLSEAKYFKWASANDLCAPTFLQCCLEALESNPGAVLAYPRAVVFTDDPARGENYPHDVDIRDKSPVDRFKRVLRDVRLNNAYTGLIRADTLRKVSANNVYQGSDIVLIAKLALRGEIMRIPQYLFYRQMNPQTASSRKDSAGLREFFASEGRDVLGRPTWDFHWHCLRAALSAPIPVEDRIRCAAHVARQFWWARRAILREMTFR